MEKNNKDNARSMDKHRSIVSSAEGISAMLRKKREKALKQNRGSQKACYLDPLTHLTNREYFYTKAFSLLETKHKRHHALGALLLIDIADFKMLNSALGYNNADACLKEAAVRLLESIEDLKWDVTLSRIGSNEFALLIGSLKMSESEAVMYVKQIVKTISEKFEAPIVLDGRQQQIRVHMGATLFRASKNELESMIHEASLALEAAKKHPSRMFYFFNEEMAEESMFKIELLDIFQNKLENRVKLYYQPIVGQTFRTVGFEVLSRWQKPSGQTVTAQHFISHLEESGQIIAFDKYVFEQACKQVRAWQGDGLMQFIDYISINICPTSFMSKDFLLFVPTMIKKYGVDPKSIMIEITENRLLSDFESVEKKMKLLSHYGIQFALDDFGTGYASLSYLHRLPFSALKIDRSLIMDVERDLKSRKIISLILMTAESVGIKVIAEGVETEGQRDLLLSMGCDCFQGYLFDSPELPMQSNAV